MTDASFDRLERAFSYAEGHGGFADWLCNVDAIVRERLGVSVFDFLDVCLRDAYDEGIEPNECVREIVYAGVLDNLGQDAADLLLEPR